MIASGSLLSIEIAKLVDADKFCLVPVQSKAGETKKAIAKWNAIDVPVAPSALDVIDLMNKLNTEAIAIVLGKRSGNLICLDIDTKNKDGFGAVITNDLKELYPHLYQKMRIDRSPSGGLHFYFRVAIDELPKITKDVASRESTSEEKLLRPDLKTKCFLEVKGEGQLSHCYPNAGYIRIKDFSGDGTISKEDYLEIYQHCKFYNEIKEREIIKPLKTVYNNYNDGENPYQCFDNSLEGENVLTDLGWGIYKNTGNFIWYSKPNAKKSYFVSASFNIAKRSFRVFNNEYNTLNQDKSYSPSSILCELSFGGDKKSLYAHLVHKGYGKIKPAIEYNIIRKAILKDEIKLPENLSSEAKEKIKEGKIQLKEKYRFGAFWIELKDGSVGFKISREKLYFVAYESGFRKYRGKTVFIHSDYKISEVDDEFFYNEIKKYIKEDSVELLDCYESFLQNSGKFTLTRLENLNTDLVLRSSKKISYKFYQNCYISITKDGIEILDYSDLNQLVWESEIKKRDFKIIDDSLLESSLYHQFLTNSIGISNYLYQCIGFYCHEHRDEEGYFIIATEKCENPEDGAGSGKNVFCSLLGLSTTYKSTPASMIKFDNNLLQSWDGQKVFCLSDMPKKFDIIFFKDIITGNANVNKKYINEYAIEIGDMCKIIGSSNYSFDDTDPGIRRRVRAIEFNDYYTLKGGVKKAHGGKMFPLDWDDLEYLCFDNIIAKSIQQYLLSDNIIAKQEMSDGGWSKQFSQKFMHLHEFIKSYFDQWVELGKVSNAVFNLNYAEFRNDNNIFKSLSSFTINKALDSYCEHHGIYKVEHGEKVRWREGIKVVGGRIFTKISESEMPSVENLEEEAPF